MSASPHAPRQISPPERGGFHAVLGHELRVGWPTIGGLLTLVGITLWTLQRPDVVLQSELLVVWILGGLLLLVAPLGVRRVTAEQEARGFLQASPVDRRAVLAAKAIATLVDLFAITIPALLLAPILAAQLPTQAMVGAAPMSIVMFCVLVAVGLTIFAIFALLDSPWICGGISTFVFLAAAVWFGVAVTGMGSHRSNHGVLPVILVSVLALLVALGLAVSSIFVGSPWRERQA